MSCREIVYDKAEQFEERYFEDNPDGDGGLSIKERRLLVVKWWNEAFEELRSDESKNIRRNAAKRVGLWVTSQKPVDRSFFPKPVRFENTPYSFFGDVLYDPQHPDYWKEKKYNFAFDVSSGITIQEEQAEDEDGHSLEEPCVWRDDEEEFDKESAEENSEDLDNLQIYVAQRREARARNGIDKVVAQYDALAEAEKKRKSKTKK